MQTKYIRILISIFLLGLIFSIAAGGATNSPVPSDLAPKDSDTTEDSDSTTDDGDHTNTTDDDDHTDETTESDHTDETTEGEDSDKSDSEKDHEEEKDKLEFKVELEVDTNKVKLKTKIANGTNEEEFKAEIDFDSTPKVKVEYSSEAGSNKTESELEVKVKSLVEFEDVNGDGLLDDNDTVVQTYKLEDIGFSDLKQSSTDIGGGFTKYVINATTVDGVFTMVFTITETFTQSNGMILKPTGIKIDYIINGFNYMSNTSRLALDSKVESTYKVEHSEDSPDEENEFSTNEASIKTSGQDTAYFSWVKTAEVDGNTTDVGVVVKKASENSQELYFIYERGDLIIHDPTVGVQAATVAYAVNVDLGRIDPALSSSIAALPATPLMATFVILLASAFVIRRRR